LPHGRLREPGAALRRAGAVVVIENDSAPGHRSPQPAIAALTSAPLYHSRRVVESLRPFPGTTEPVALLGRSVVVFSGIGDPESFVRSVEACGAEIAEVIARPDHHRFTESELARVGGIVRRRGAVAVTTGKDAARLGRRGLPFPAAVLHVSIECPELCAFVRTVLADLRPREVARAR
jgi:tetraacyldisaccharide 4'-kinase